MKLTLEESDLLERAKIQGDVSSDVRDNYDTLVEAYRDWCRVQRRPFLHIALGNETSRVIFSLLEAGTSCDYGKLIWLSLNFDETGFLIGKPGVLFPHGKSAL